MHSSDRIVVVLLVVGIIVISTAFAVFSFYDPIQAAVFEGAKEVIGAPVQWQFNFQHPFSENERDLYRFHNFLLGINNRNLCLGRRPGRGRGMAVPIVPPSGWVHLRPS
jgi:hypothetical protein